MAFWLFCCKTTEIVLYFGERRRMKMNGKILIFGELEENLLCKIRLAAQSQAVQLRAVQLREYDRTVGQIAMLPTVEGNYSGPGIDEPMLVLCVPHNALDGVLAALRNAGVPPICKAVLTSTNAAWTPEQLLAELQRERAEFLKMRS